LFKRQLWILNGWERSGVYLQTRLHGAPSTCTGLHAEYFFRVIAEETVVALAWLDEVTKKQLL